MNRTGYGSLLLLLGVLLPGLALARFPPNPTSMAQCDAVAQQYRALYQQHQQLASQGITDRNRLQLSRECAGNEQCRAQYYHRVGEYHKVISHHHQERDRIRREWDAGEQSCRSVARVHEQQNDQQRRMAQDNERRNRQAYEDNQRRQNAAQLQESSQQQERNQPRVIASTPPSYYDNRNQPRIVQSPQQQAYQAQEQRNAAISQQQAQTQALANVFGALAQAFSAPRAASSAAAPASANALAGRSASEPAYTPGVTPSNNESRNADSGSAESGSAGGGTAVTNTLRDGWAQVRNFASTLFNPPDTSKPAAPQIERAQEMADENNAARRRMLDSVLNPGGVRTPGIDNTVEQVQDVNQRMNRGGPLVTQIQNDGFSAVGSSANNTLGQLDQGLEQIDQIRVEAGATATSVPQQVAIANTGNTPASPEANCGRRMFFALQQCLQRECEKVEFKGHAQCVAKNETRRND